MNGSLSPSGRSWAIPLCNASNRSRNCPQKMSAKSDVDGLSPLPTWSGVPRSASVIRTSASGSGVNAPLRLSPSPSPSSAAVPSSPSACAPLAALSVRSLLIWRRTQTTFCFASPTTVSAWSPSGVFSSTSSSSRVSKASRRSASTSRKNRRRMTVRAQSLRARLLFACSTTAIRPVSGASNTASQSSSPSRVIGHDGMVSAAPGIPPPDSPSHLTRADAECEPVEPSRGSTRGIVGVLLAALALQFIFDGIGASGFLSPPSTAGCPAPRRSPSHGPRRRVPAPAAPHTLHVAARAEPEGDVDQPIIVDPEKAKGARRPLPPSGVIAPPLRTSRLRASPVAALWLASALRGFVGVRHE